MQIVNHFLVLWFTEQNRRKKDSLPFLGLLGQRISVSTDHAFHLNLPELSSTLDSKTQHRVWLESIRTRSVLSLRMNCHLLLKHSGGIGFVPAGFPIIGVRLHRITAMF